MKTRFNFSILLIAFALIACGKKTDIMSSTSSLNNVDAFAAQTLGNDVKWDGEGTEFSGNYTFNFSASTLKCPGAQDQNFPALAAVYRCTQKDAVFACGKPTEEVGSESFQGNISKDGKFKLFRVTMGTAQATAMSGMRNGEAKLMFAGAINSDAGKAQYSMIQQNAQRQGVCTANYQLSVQAAAN